MTLKCLKPTMAVLAAAAVGVPLSGCSTNDNPINPDKMNQIRQQESRDRANFKPNVPPPNGK